MLETTKTTTINGTSKSEDNQIIATMYCTFNENGTISSGSNIINQELYEANKEEVRTDIDKFTALYRSNEDMEAQL